MDLHEITLEGVTEILQHSISWRLRGAGEVPKELDECSIEHIKKLLKEDYREGELCVCDQTGSEFRGWWIKGSTAKHAMKIEFPAGFWREVRPGRQTGTIEIGTTSFHVEAIEVCPVDVGKYDITKAAYPTDQDAIANLYYLSGAATMLETINIDGKPHVVFMTPYGA